VVRRKSFCKVRLPQISLKKSLSHCRWDGGVIP
jgi:hypothetical protein